jgi:hypothetical protein
MSVARDGSNLLGSLPVKPRGRVWARVTYSQPGSDTKSCGTPKEGRRTPVPRIRPDARQRHDTAIPGKNGFINIMEYYNTVAYNNIT